MVREDRPRHGGSTVGLAEPGPHHFGDMVTIVATTDDPKPQGMVTVQAYLNGVPSGGLDVTTPLYEAEGVVPSPRVVLGPTPTWDNDGGHPWDRAVGAVSLVTWRDRGLEKGGPDKAGWVTLAGPVPFDVLP